MKYVALMLLLSSTASGAPQDKLEGSSEALAVVEAWLEAQKDFEQLPGLAAAVIKDQKVLWKAGFGWANIEGKVQATPDTLFSVCSISKLFTSVAIMTLYDEGKLRLDDDIADLLPWYNLKQDYPDSGPITVRALLTHSSGLPREADYPYWTGPDFPFPTTAEVKHRLGEQKTLHPASAYFQYSNLGMALLGEVVAKVSGQRFEAYIEEKILKPLDLQHTRTELPKDLYGQQLAIGYSALNRKAQREKVAFFQAKGLTPAAGFSSNVGDLAAFAQWQLRLLGSTSPEILKPSTLKNMQRVHWTNPDWKSTWGLGFSVRKDDKGRTVVGHSGGCPGYRSEFMLYPKSEEALVVMINASGTEPAKYAKGIKAIIEELPPIADDNSKEGQDRPDLSEYRGYYNSQPWWGEVFVTGYGDKLITLGLPSDHPAQTMARFRYIEKDTFRRIRDDGRRGATMTFQRDKSGKVISYKLHGNFRQKIVH